MAVISRSSSLLVLSLMLFCSMAAAALGRPGGWVPVDPKSAEAVAAGKFAVGAHNKAENDSLKFEGVKSGEEQVVAGIKYKLVVDARGGGDGGVRSYEAVVWDNSSPKSYQLISFKKL
ncbi:unnamed protein product [Cuscuta campestris]|uniref:Cystatin domain-containing protein n=2 Tax=Cuscuta sect. Cleistogrammica TaxID=1824901 RepID=A0A484KZB8_9ASTE|nr:hypothetical protein DM860_005457 [Cuscuta australis]VFQ68096.1 unnamed protein product [Cuscuta campestris]